MPKISELPLAGPITGDETFPIVQAGETRRAALGDLVGGMQTSLGLAAYSAQFPNFNRQFEGLAGHIAYPLTNLMTAPLLSSGTPGAFFIMLYVPYERTKQNRQHRVIGNEVGDNPASFSLLHYGDDFNSSSLHDRFRWQSRPAGGILPSITLDIDVQTRKSDPQLLVLASNGSGGFSIASYAAGKTKISGTSLSGVNHSLAALTGTHLLVGDVGSAAGGLAAYNEPNSAFPGGIAFHGFVNGTAGNDAQWQAIAEGADIVATLGGAATYSLLRDYRSGGSSLADRLKASAPGDTTLEGTIHGTVTAGGTMTRQQAGAWIEFARLPDGYVLSPPDDSDTGSVQLPGSSAGVSGDVMARIVSPNGDLLVPPFRLGPVAANMVFDVDLPTFPAWGHFEAWATSHPNLIYRMTSRIGCGDKAALTGQSQIDLAIMTNRLTLDPSGLASFCVWLGDRSDPGDTTSSPVARFDVAKRANIFVIEPQMRNAYNGVTAFAERVSEHNGGRAICVVDRAVSGTSVLAWINDSISSRLWAQDEEIAQDIGRDLTPVHGWYTSDAGSYPSAFDALVRGSGPDRSTHFYGDGTIQLSGYKMGIALPTRATNGGAGPNAADNFGTSRSGAQAGQIAFATANPTLAVVGPANTDIAIDNQAGGTISAPNDHLSGPHESQVLREGAWRFGYRMGEAYLRAKGKSPSPFNSFLDRDAVTINGGRNVITIPARLRNPGGRLQTDNNMFRFDAAPAAGESVSIDGHQITFVAAGATGQQVNIGADAAATALALRNYIAANLAASHTVHHWNRMVTVECRRRQQRPVLASASAAVILPGATITGAEISVDDGLTWNRFGFTPALVGNDAVTLTKTSGSWPAGVRLRFYEGGPFSYGTIEELNAPYKGHLYDGCEANNGLGWPLLGFSSVTIP